ncbi:hypothetical protein PVAP13_9KG291313 [Panicum virgatum]|uniref:Uncharacterized protein n=1 Tax=Panicum virgatum TaxID=38727 RepID=A0A8T0NI07_PANVG|nr:hypothetical protein PVAP13_9KG291313 [Panicum virgatum]
MVWWGCDAIRQLAHIAHLSLRSGRPRWRLASASDGEDHSLRAASHEDQRRRLCDAHKEDTGDASEPNLVIHSSKMWSSDIGRVQRLRLIKHGGSHSRAHGHQRRQARRRAARHGTSITRMVYLQSSHFPPLLFFDLFSYLSPILYPPPPRSPGPIAPLSSRIIYKTPPSCPPNDPFKLGNLRDM